MGNYFTVDRKVFEWEYTEEPHRSRRIEILNKHPEIKELMPCQGDRSLFLAGVLVFVLHFGLGLLCQRLAVTQLGYLIIALGGTWTATMAILLCHEAAHGNVFGPNHVWKNRMFGIWMNLCLATPSYAYFKLHHKRHHKFLADEILDIEYPSEFEAQYFPKNALGKYLWFLCHPMIHAIRSPTFVVQRFHWECDLELILNILIVGVVDLALLYFPFNILVNFSLGSSLFAAQTFMFGFWGNMTHTLFFPHRENYCYYGWMNKVFFNFGYHFQHHDFPNVPAYNLPKLDKIARESYEDVFELNSYIVAAIKFLFDPRLSVASRLKRPNPHPEKYSNDHTKNYRLFREPPSSG